jgi:hypothetical protein
MNISINDQPTKCNYVSDKLSDKYQRPFKKRKFGDSYVPESFDFELPSGEIVYGLPPLVLTVIHKRPYPVLMKEPAQVHQRPYPMLMKEPAQVHQRPYPVLMKEPLA